MKSLVQPFIIAILFLFLHNTGISQSKIIVAEKHTIFISIPENWIQVPMDGVQLLIRPFENKQLDEETYMYVLGLDYATSPDVDQWIESNTNYLTKTVEGVVVDSLSTEYSNLLKDNYMTGRYKTITYTYLDGRKEVLLVIECKNTIVTVVLSTKDEESVLNYMPSFESFARSAKIVGTTVQKE